MYANVSLDLKIAFLLKKKKKCYIYIVSFTIYIVRRFTRLP